MISKYSNAINPNHINTTTNNDVVITKDINNATLAVAFRIISGLFSEFFDNTIAGLTNKANNNIFIVPSNTPVMASDITLLPY